MISRGICNISNVTLIFLNYQYNNLAFLNETTLRIDGKLGPLSDYLIGERRCKLISANEVGYEYENGSLTGTVRMLAEKRGDMVLQVMNYYKQSRYVDYTQPLVNEPYVAVHPLDHLKSVQADLTIYDMLHIDKWYFVFYLFQLIFTTVFLVVQLRERYFDFRRVVLKQRMNEYFSLTKRLLEKRSNCTDYNLTLKVLRVCFLLYAHVFLVFFTISLVNISLSTNKVLVDYSSVIYDRSQMQKTERQLCFFKNQGIWPFFRTSPKNCFYRKIYDAKYRRCHMGYGLIRGRHFLLNGFLITNYAFANIVVGSLTGHTRKPYWISKEIFSMNVANMIRKSLDPTTKRTIRSYALRYLEANLHNHVRRRMVHESRYFNFGTNQRVFESLDAIIAEHTKFISNDLRSYRMVFLALFSLELAVFVFFLAFELWKKLRDPIRRLYRIYLKRRQMRQERKAREKQLEQERKETKAKEDNKIKNRIKNSGIKSSGTKQHGTTNNVASETKKANEKKVQFDD